MSTQTLVNNKSQKLLQKIIRTLIIDNHQETIQDLIKQLRHFNEIEVIDFATNIRDGLKKVICSSPDLLFLDEEMPNKTGYEFYNELTNTGIRIPKVIFTSEHGLYAIKALHHNAIDYLTKPIDNFELTMAIQRYKKVIMEKNENHKLEVLAKNSIKNKRILLPNITGLKQISLDSVLYFQKEHNKIEKVEICYGISHSEFIPGHISLKNLIDLLPEQDFFQIDRHTIINLDYLTDIEVKTRTCILNKCDEVIHLSISRGRLKKFREKCRV
ncbi:LytR/AlgR family response regulator transcription factor [Saccharicrinis sp. 156]|uniref:LytR/AlgR family response regulator transcription factor n=1 Tax=Saccharicrinis sp. 156 TaxID=3417574 RepID=UPI003D33011A